MISVLFRDGTVSRETATQDAQRKQMGAARRLETEQIPPTKEVHYSPERCMLIQSASTYATLPYGSNATLRTTNNLLPGCPVVM